VTSQKTPFFIEGDSSAVNGRWWEGTVMDKKEDLLLRTVL
jgi:hypothetical protein